MNRSMSYNKLAFIAVVTLSFFMPAAFGQKAYSEIPAGDKITSPDSLSQNPADKIKFYPVPAKTELNLENISSVTVVEIFDVMGKKHISVACKKQDQLTIQISQLPRGVYFIRFVTPGSTVMKRFIKE